MVFADIRGSSKLARSLSTMEFTHLMNRFYVARDVWSSTTRSSRSSWVMKSSGFLPFLAGSEHARRALEAATRCSRLRVIDPPTAPWAPLGAGVHTGTAFVGVVGAKDALDFTALGDRVNIAAHLASQAAAGEPLHRRGREERGTDDRRRGATCAVALKGFDVDALVLRS